MVDLSPGATRRMLYGMGMEGLAVACNYIGFKEQVFSRLLWHLHGSGTLAMFRMNPKHKEAMDYYQSIDSGQAATLIHSLRTAPPD